MRRERQAAIDCPIHLFPKQEDEENTHCQLCQQFSKLRRKTAEIVIKAGRLDERRQA